MTSKQNNNYNEDYINDSKILKNLRANVLKVLTPPPDMSISDWAEQNIVISKGPSKGPYNADTAPYLRGMLDAYLSPDYHTIVPMWAAQLGKSLGIQLIISYLIANKPAEMMFGLPDESMIDSFYKSFLQPIFENTKVLKDKIQAAKPGKAGSKLDYIKFIGGFLKISSANSVSAMAMLPIMYLFLDEVGKFPKDLKDQGSSVDQFKARTKNFIDAKIYITGTPTFAGDCPIEREYLKGTMSEYFVPCIHCNEQFVLDTGHIRWEKETLFNGDTKHLTDTAYIECPHCKGKIKQNDKIKMLRRGSWIATNPNPTDGVWSSHLHTLYSPFVPISEVANAFVTGCKNEAGLKSYTQLWEGRPFKARGDQPDWELIFKRAEPYQPGVCPAGVCWCTASVDIQTGGKIEKDGRLEVAIYGWGRNDQAWLIKYAQIHGDPNQDQVWEELDYFLSQPLKNYKGIDIPLRAVAIDSSDGNTRHDAYAYVKRHKNERTKYIAIKGSNNYDAPVISQGKLQEVDARGKYNKFSIKLYSVGTHLIKSIIYNRLHNEIPGSKGYMHFYKTEDPYFFKMLTAEKLVTKTERGVNKQIWEKVYERNEGLDLTVYAYAAAVFSNLHNENWDRAEANIGLNVDFENMEDSEQQEEEKEPNPFAKKVPATTTATETKTNPFAKSLGLNKAYGGGWRKRF